jgi:hypothetical protein
MPDGDRTGPMGLGQMTGRGTGVCAGEPSPGAPNGPGGRGRGFGGGGGRVRRRRRNRFHATGLTGWQRAEAGVPASEGSQEAVASEPRPQTTSDSGKQQALDLLKSEAKRYANGLEQMEKRIAELEAELQEE